MPHSPSPDARPLTQPPLTQPLRKGRLARLARMASAGVSMASSAVGRGLGRDGLAPLARAADELSELRGLAAKAGQMASVWTATLPASERERVAPVLARLRAQTMRSEPDAVRALVESELGGPWQQSFATLDPMPFASASLGQVHRARLLPEDGGLEVAVKVQHPGIDAALRADLDNVSHVGALAALFAVTGAEDLVAEVRARLLEELDYEREARWQRRFRALWADDADVHVPAVIDRCSRSRVLTTELVRGASVEEAALGPDAHAKGLTVRRFVRESLLQHGLLFADPHAGNWIFHDGARVTVLDFGSVVELEAPTREALAETLADLSAARDAHAERRLARLLGGGDTPSEPTVLLARSMALSLSPLARERPVRRADLAALSQVTMEAKAKSLGRRLRLPTWMPLVARALVGTMALLTELESGAA